MAKGFQAPETAIAEGDSLSKLFSCIETGSNNNVSGVLPLLDCFVAPLLAMTDGQLPKQYPPKGSVLCGIVILVGCRLLNGIRPKGRALWCCYLRWLPPAQRYPPKEACYSVLSFRPGEHHRKAALLP
ncbi:MAG: hypothetical protein LBT00_07570 [Spirochaetaceae bacterium]|nr:hypothetical protein [Spirochaetaceae bacterium]